MFQSRAKLDGEPPVRDQNETDHQELLAGALGAPHERAVILTIQHSRARAFP
jgi:hypothetical protein